MTTELAGLPVPTMDLNAPDAPQLFKKFKAKCTLIFEGPLKDKSEKEKVNYLLIWSGDDGIELASTWTLTEDEEGKLATYWKKFEDFVVPKSNFRLSRFKLRSMKQGAEELVNLFVKRLRVLAQECNFANPDEHLIDALIFGTNSDQVRSKLLKEPADMTFNKAIDIARTEEATKRQIQGEYHIVLDETVPPVVHPPRRIPEALRKPFKAELDSLCAQEILKKVDKPTDWVNSFVCVTKPNGSIRLCLDPKDLNKATKRPHHYTPTLEDILAKLNGAKYFSIVDARSGYWNIKLDEESSYYTTFNSPFGRYRFCRLPFGLICAQDVFQKKVDETFGDLTGVTGIADDIVVVGFKEDGSDHDTNLQAVMERARSTGLKFNPDKCVIKSTSIPFYGHILSANGLKVDPSKVEAINALDPSSSLPDLQSFLGATQYLSRFIPHMASVAAPLWDLVKKSSEFVWSPEHQAAVDKIKQAIAAPTSLKYFDSKKPVVVQVDASQRGLGAVLLQDNQPLAYSSKLLTDTERRYSNIEREMLGVVHGLEKFHYYCYGRPVVVQTDHKPLEAISKKHLASAPPRIARMLLRIQKYNAQVTYIPGKDIPLADALSRISPCPGDEIPGLDVSEAKKGCIGAHDCTCKEYVNILGTNDCYTCVSGVLGTTPKDNGMENCLRVSGVLGTTPKDNGMENCLRVSGVLGTTPEANGMENCLRFSDMVNANKEKRRMMFGAKAKGPRNDPNIPTFRKVCLEFLEQLQKPMAWKTVCVCLEFLEQLQKPMAWKTVCVEFNRP
ncbi:hypothetical protein QZH41_006643 [Actinostola sp. cb2023]|nr:hypothetical protein QZH41_006643 [Actinostola sp. cb2023]